MTRFADIEILHYRVPGFENLPLRTKLYIYHLAEAALWGRDILWDQNGRYNLRIRHLLESILPKTDNGDFRTYMRQVWFANGIHHHYSTDKFQPGFSEEWLRQYTDDETLINVIMNPEVMPKRVCQNGDDLIKGSASNYYGEGITQQQAEDYYNRMKASDPNPDRAPSYGMNSRLELTAEGTLEENVYRIGGLYGAAIERICGELEQAKNFAESGQQKKVIDMLLEFYRTGDLATFDRYTIEWVKETDGFVDFINGFTETYGDPLGLKASWEGYVNYRDAEATKRADLLSANAQWFEDHSPVDARFKKKECKGVSARVVNAAILGGDLYPSSAIGINLPNSNWVRAVHGSKSVTIGNLTAAYEEAAKGSGFREEFVIDRETVESMNRYSAVTDDLHTDLHECLGHGSGQLLPGVDQDALGVYGATIEEARADLFGLYYIADHKMTELGLTPDDQAWRAQYYGYMMNGAMTQLVRIKRGRVIEEAHMRNRSLIAHWCLEQARYWGECFGTKPAMELVIREGKTYLLINDYITLRQYVGQLLAEIQRIKSEGDFQAAKALVEKYAIDIDEKLHEEMLQRYERLHLSPYKGFVNPVYTLVKDAEGNVCDVTVSYDEEFDEQQLRYSRQYATL